MQLREDLRDLRDVFGETSLIHLIGDVSEICKLALFEMSPRHCMRRLRDASEMHPCRLGNSLFKVCRTFRYMKNYSVSII